MLNEIVAINEIRELLQGHSQQITLFEEQRTEVEIVITYLAIHLFGQYQLTKSENGANKKEHTQKSRLILSSQQIRCLALTKPYYFRSKHYSESVRLLRMI